ncbi:P-loop containing nucleoside triphosphate hydrolase protein [Piromyces finnis]|uniref:p-loop containing nucleoside triphosphate hydrolase protein n=1 Tax=Piromyces finnis TaxID=1754191 RepID=A0A1Y1VE28_9FUNG|nr:P-loop containing nucleoside triphosphate hydrolase protein [Piromyces finnis]|eukprot:ORX53885.1 P-loop containing nucleoside triphosphate hydrolase protein [Piromyces finnis]
MKYKEINISKLYNFIKEIKQKETIYKRELLNENELINENEEYTIAFYGMQSHGKSSAIESITDIYIPQGNNTVTLCPLKLVIRNSIKNSIEESVTIKYENDEEIESIRIEDIGDKVAEYQNRLKEKYRDELSEDDSVTLFDEVIEVEVHRGDYPNLTIYDLPGITLNNYKIQDHSERISRKYLMNEKTTVFLVITAGDEMDNMRSVQLMKEIPNYKKKFIPVISKSDMLNENNVNSIVNQVKNLELKNKPYFIVNKYGEYKNLSNEDMKKKEMNILNGISSLKNDPNVNLGTKKLIDNLINIEIKNLFKTLSNVNAKLEKNINLCNRKLTNFQNNKDNNKPEDARSTIHELINEFSREIIKKTKMLECNEEGLPRKNLIIYKIKLNFRECIKDVKTKMNKLLTKEFCNKVTNNIIQNNADNISIVGDGIPFNLLLTEEIENIFEVDIKNSIDTVYNIMYDDITSFIDDFFKDYPYLKDEINYFFEEYAMEKKNAVIKFYKELKTLNSNRISTYNSDLIIKHNYLVKEINSCLLEGSIDIYKSNNDLNVDDEYTDNDNTQYEETEYVNNNDSTYSFGEETDYVNNNDSTYSFGEETDYMNNNDSTDKFGKKILKRNNKNTKNSILFIKCLVNYENDKIFKKKEYNECIGRNKVALSLDKILNFDDKLYDNNTISFIDEYAFVPGFQYIKKDNLDKFKEHIKNGSIEIKTANIVVQMLSYIEIMLNRVLDMIFMSAETNLYDKLIDNDMIGYIKSKIGSNDLPRLLEMPQKQAEEKLKLENKLKEFKELKKKYDELNINTK